MKQKLFVLAFAVVVLIVGGCAPQEESADKGAETKSNTGATQETKMSTVDYDKDVKPTLATYCAPCHIGPDSQEGIDVSVVAATDKAKLAKMLHEIEEGKMPPEKSKQIPAADKAKLVEHLKSFAG